VLLGKCLSIAPQLLLLNNPTRGVDIGARQEIYRIIRELSENGMAIILVSEDLPELIGLSDRIVVLRGGAVTHRFDPELPIEQNQIIRHMA
jgi:ribose transport system ATP-binding protein